MASAGEFDFEEPAAPSSGRPAREKPQKKKNPLLLVLLLVVLVGALLAKIVDVKARQSSQAAFDQLNGAIDQFEADVNAKRLTPEGVHNLLGRGPDDPMYETSTSLIEEFSWQGVPKRYTVYVRYQPGTPPEMHDVSLNEPPEGGK